MAELVKTKSGSELTVHKVFCHWKWGNNPTRDEYQGRRVAIWSNCYSTSVEHIKWLADILKKDFPDLEDDDMDICIYGGSSKKGMLGIEFNVGARVIPPSYSKVAYMEVHLH